MKIFKLLFCKFFQFSEYIGNSTDDGVYAYKSMGILTLFFSLNIISLCSYYKFFIDHSKNIFLSRSLEIIVIVIVGAFFSILFLKDGRYRDMYKEFKDNTEINGKKGTWVTIFYIAATVLLLMSLIWLR